MPLSLSAYVKRILPERSALMAIAAALSAMLIAHGYLATREAELLKIAEPMDVAIAARDIADGEFISAQDAKIRKMPRRYLEPGAIASSQDLMGRVAAINIKMGSQITKSSARLVDELSALSTIIPSGMMALAVPVKRDSGILALTKAGDLIDLMAAFDIGDSSGGKRALVTICERVPVLAIGNKIAGIPVVTENRKGSKGMVKSKEMVSTSDSATMTVALPPNDLRRVAFAISTGDIMVGLRPLADDSPPTKPAPITISTITGDGSQLLLPRRNFREYKGR